jgi:hypothetical protein
MEAVLRDSTIFHLTGQHPAGTTGTAADPGLRPALLARYRNLARLRHDFPVVLVNGDDAAVFVRSLSGIVDEVLRKVAPRGHEGEGLRRHVLHVECEIRRMVAEGASGRLSELWALAVDRAAIAAGTPLGAYLAEAGAAIGVDGPVFGCDEGLPARFFEHGWRITQARKAAAARLELNRLVVRLGDLLRADFVKSEAGSRPESLQACFGDRHQGLFDFDAMSRLVGRASHGSPLTAERRRRIERVLAVLRSERFFGSSPVDGIESARPAVHDFAACNCAAAATLYRERLP